MKKFLFLVCFVASTTFATANNTTGGEKPATTTTATTEVVKTTPNTDPKKDECGNDDVKYTCKVSMGDLTITIDAPDKASCAAAMKKVIDALN